MSNPGISHPNQRTAFSPWREWRTWSYFHFRWRNFRAFSVLRGKTHCVSAAVEKLTPTGHHSRMMTFPKTPILAAILLALPLLSSQAETYAVEKKGGILFAEPGGVQLLLDLYLSKGVENPPWRLNTGLI